MSIEIKVPMLPESVADATIVKWHKKVGDSVKRDETVVDLETDKVMLEVPAPEDGILDEIKYQEGATVKSNELLALINQNGANSQTQSTANSTKATQKSSAAKASGSETSPAVRRMAAEHDLDVTQVAGSGKGGKVMKQDVVEFIKRQQDPSVNAQQTGSAAQQVTETISTMPGERLEKRVPMSRLRAKIAERLVQAQHNAAMLTTFNEVNLQAVMNLRAQYKDVFEKKHGVRLGFMSFFTKAVIEALKRFPAVNASIDGSDIVYHGYFDIGIAVSTERGLVVPVVRDADTLSMAELETKIAAFANKARDGKLALEDMQGGTFTITNGGVFGSLLATPILNPPQAGILGMHKIEERPVVEKGAVVIRPMMYIALSYDHRLIDGKESVQFLVTVKEMLEDPQRLLLEV